MWGYTFSYFKKNKNWENGFELFWGFFANMKKICLTQNNKEVWEGKL